MNVLAYTVYLLITFFITIKVGFIFYNNGRYYLHSLLRGDDELTAVVSNLLLTGYYLLNLGYAALMLNNWQTIYNWEQLISSISNNCGKIFIILALIHYCNMAVIALLNNRHTIPSNNKK